jgi:hypothetical protein
MTFTEYLSELTKAMNISANDLILHEQLRTEFIRLFPGEYDLAIERIDNDTCLNFSMIFYDIEIQTEWLLRYG